MRLIKTFVLHLYFDIEAPERLCGDVRSLDGLNQIPFKNQVELENLLRWLIVNTLPSQSNRFE